MHRGLGNFNDEPDNPDNVMRSAGPEDRNSLGVHPLRAGIAPHDAELSRFVLGTIRPERLHRDLVKSAAILRMHAPQEQMEFSGNIALNSEDLPQLVRPILFAGVKINVEESDFFCPPEFHFHLFPSFSGCACTGGDLFAFSLEQTCCVLLETSAGPNRLHSSANIFSELATGPSPCRHNDRTGVAKRAVACEFEISIRQVRRLNPTVRADRSARFGRRMTLLFESFAPDLFSTQFDAFTRQILTG